MPWTQASPVDGTLTCRALAFPCVLSIVKRPSWLGAAAGDVMSMKPSDGQPTAPRGDVWDAEAMPKEPRFSWRRNLRFGSAIPAPTRRWLRWALRMQTGGSGLVLTSRGEPPRVDNEVDVPRR